MAARPQRLPSPDHVWRVGDTRIIQIPIWEVEPNAAGQGGVPADPDVFSEMEFGMVNLRDGTTADLHLGSGITWASGQPCSVDVEIDTEALGLTWGEYEGVLRVTDEYGPRSREPSYLITILPSPSPLPSGRQG